MIVTVKKLSELHKPAVNVRRHTKKQLDEYIRSVKMFGQIRPIVVDEDGEIIAGNGLYDALLASGATECDCYVMTGITEVQKKKLMLADNRVYELGISDSEAFDQIVRELEADFDVPGYDEDLLATINASLEEVTNLIDSYGVYSENEVSNINNKPRIDHDTYQAPPNPPLAASPVEQAMNAGPAQTNVINPAIQPQVQAQSEQTSSQERSLVQRTVVCPKCGERICL